MKNKFLILMFHFIFLVNCSVFANENPNELIAKDFPGWKIHSFVAGSLYNKRSHDLALILVNEESKTKTENTEANDLNYALLVIYLENQNKNLNLHTKSEKSICVDCAGAKAAPGPIAQLSVGKNGLFIMTYAGGSREIWKHILKWRLDSKTNKFLLIGETYTSEDTLHQEPNTFLDINYLALKAEKKIGKKRKISCSVGEDFKRIELDSYEYDFGTRQAKIAESCR